jgi:hypothetical protein
MDSSDIFQFNVRLSGKNSRRSPQSHTLLMDEGRCLCTVRLDCQKLFRIIGSRTLVFGRTDVTRLT